MKRKVEHGLLFLMKKILDEKDDYRVRLYILAWIASLCAMLALVIGALLFLFKAFELLFGHLSLIIFISVTGIPLSFPDCFLPPSASLSTSCFLFQLLSSSKNLL